MKKTYFAPESVALEMKAEKMIAASVGVSKTEVNANQALSGRKDMWGKSDMWE